MGLIARTIIEVQWGDCDPAQIVFYPNYFRWFDASAHRLFAAAGLDWQDLERLYGLTGVSLVGAEASFRQPLRYRDQVEVVSRVKEWRRKTFVIEHLLMKGGEVAAEGQETRAWLIRDATDPLRFKAAEIPRGFIHRFS